MVGIKQQSNRFICAFKLYLCPALTSFWSRCIFVFPPSIKPGYIPPEFFTSLRHFNKYKKDKNPGGDQKPKNNFIEKPPGILRRVKHNLSLYCSVLTAFMLPCAPAVKYERIKFLVIALKNSVEIYAWAPKPYHKFMAFKVRGARTCLRC